MNVRASSAAPGNDDVPLCSLSRSSMPNSATAAANPSAGVIDNRFGTAAAISALVVAVGLLVAQLDRQRLVLLRRGGQARRGC